VPQYDKAALGWFYRAASQGNTAALSSLTRVASKLLADDQQSAVEWVIKSLELGDTKFLDARFSKATGRSLQNLLKYRGLYKGAVDGAVGPQTRAAMRRLLPN
jgi:peptidoglycan hydrolase-like protein with peptidoglycan-binding domain